MISSSRDFTSSDREWFLSNYKLYYIYLYQIGPFAVKKNLKIMHQHVYRATSDRNARNTKKSSHTKCEKLGRVGLNVRN